MGTHGNGHATQCPGLRRSLKAALRKNGQRHRARGGESDEVTPPMVPMGEVTLEEGHGSESTQLQAEGATSRGCIEAMQVATSQPPGRHSI